MSDNISSIFDNINNAEDKHTASIATLTVAIDSMEKNVEAKLESKVSELLTKLETAVVSMNENKDSQCTDMRVFKEELQSVMDRVDDINEKMYDFEANKRNNLIFYGIPNEVKETPGGLLQKINKIIKTSLGLRRDIPVSKVEYHL